MGGSGEGTSHTRPRRGSTRAVGGTGGTGTPSGVNPCALIDELVRLSSPKPTVIAQLHVGEVLQLTINNNAPPILASSANGNVAGSVVPSSLQKLLECMKAKFKYIATVESIKGGICVVRITPA